VQLLLAVEGVLVIIKPLKQVGLVVAVMEHLVFQLEHLEANLDQQHLLELVMHLVGLVVAVLDHLTMKVVAVVAQVEMLQHLFLELMVPMVELELPIHIALVQTNQEQVAVVEEHGL
jgi:hypothetical protein